MKVFNTKLIALMAVFAFFAAFDPARNAYAAIPISEQPLFTQTALPPLMMMVMSRDEQLFNKAYPDYTDLDADGLLDTTYQNNFNYSGYFDPHICYDYSGGQFAASGAATGTNQHQCGGNWSGNFLNWITMSRLDVLRYVLYGGKRSTDAATTVLERAPIPNDLHAWVKVYSGSDINLYTPVATPTSFCNATLGGNPIMRAASGVFSEWAATALNQCNWREDIFNDGAHTCNGASADSSCHDDAPKSNAIAGGSTGDFTVRVQVCGNASSRETFCQKYTDAGVDSYKPVGLLQNYGETGAMRFGLLTGSFSKPRSGGVLRRNIGRFAGNIGTLNAEGCAAGDEVNTKNGRFCNQSGTSEGIVKTMDALQLTQWNGSKWADCNDYSILNRQGQQTNVTDRYLNNPGSGGAAKNCNAWGNPLSEMYAEAVRYISANGRTAGFNDAANDLAGLPAPTWLDPFRSIETGGSPYCAKCNILVISTGLNSFDSDEIPTTPNLPSSAAASTQTVGSYEGISGSYLVGRVATGTPGNLAVGTSVDTHADLCTAKTVADLGLVRGLCPDIPSMEGSYLLDGLAFEAHTTDLRPELTSPDGTPKPETEKTTVKTFAVSLAENLPKFQIPVGTGSIKLAPLAQANNTGSAQIADTGWRSSFLGSVSIGPKTSTLNSAYIYGRALEADSSAGSFTFVWEDSLWGNDHDNDVVTMVTYCVGAKCDRQTNLPLGVCFYTATNFNGNEFCPTTAAGNTTGNMPTTPTNFSALVQSVRVPAGRTLRLYTGTGQTGTTRDITADNVDLGTGTTGRNTAKSYRISGGNVPVPYAGKDICWRTDGTNAAALDYSEACGTAGTPTIGENDVLIRIENISAYAGNAMLTGYAISGSDADGLKRLTLRPGSGVCTNCNNSLMTKNTAPPTQWYKPMVRKYTVGSAAAKQLENPLFYAAKYGSFIDINSNGRPDAGEWDSRVAGVPDNFFAVTNPAKLKEELQKVFNQALDDANPTASTATSTPRFVPGGTLAYQVSFNAKDWTGNVEAFELNPNGTLGAGVWSAKDDSRLPAAASRNIVTSQFASGAFTGTPFTVAGLTAATRTTVLGPLVAPFNITDLIAFLRGDQTKETSAPTPGPYRSRSSRIGDVLNSTPAVQARTTFGYGRLPTTINGVATGKDLYPAFVQDKDLTPTVYVGANDGMLHAFDGAADSGGGVEKFAYIPNAVLGKLNRLAVPTYTHTYFVDGTPLIGDAFNGTAWQTVLLGSTGAGARSVFALNITDPEALGADSVMWEFNDQIDTDMGTAIVQPSMGLAEDGVWRAAFGNGFNSANNRAMLFVRDLWTGAAVAKVDTGVGTAADPNGLATATMVDTDGNGAGDTIYAGDFYGNMWKFVYSGGNWVIGTNAAGNQAPLFTATDDLGHRQPITSGVYTVANPFGGTMVLFGTGKYLSVDDADPLHTLPDGTSLVDSIYAIWDAPPLGSTGSPCEEPPVLPTRGNMLEQTITADSGGYRASSQTPFDFLCTSDGASDGKMGWFMDLTFTPPSGTDLMHGERVVAAPTVILGTLLVNTFKPVGDVCVPGGENFLFELDALTGAANFSEVLPEGGGGAPPPPAGSGTGGTLIGTGPPQGSPLPVVDIPTPPTIPPITCYPGSADCEPIVGGTGSNDCKWTLPNPANKSIQTPIPCGRVSWRQLR